MIFPGTAQMRLRLPPVYSCCSRCLGYLKKSLLVTCHTHTTLHTHTHTRCAKIRNYCFGFIALFATVWPVNRFVGSANCQLLNWPRSNWKNKFFCLSSCACCWQVSETEDFYRFDWNGMLSMKCQRYNWELMITQIWCLRLRLRFQVKMSRLLIKIDQRSAH